MLSSLINLFLINSTGLAFLWLFKLRKCTIGKRSETSEKIMPFVLESIVSILSISVDNRCLYTRLKEHSTRENSEIYAHINSCEHFQDVKSLLELSPDLSNTICTDKTQLISNNCKRIDKSDHWSLLLFKESLAIRRRKPELNHGAKASKELIIFQ